MKSLQENAPSALHTLGSVIMVDGDHPDKVIAQASADIEYATGLFGRDILTAALDTLSYKPEIARRVLKLFATKQGTKWDEVSPDHPATEEQPGRILHEERSHDEPSHLRSLFGSLEEYNEFVTHCKQKSKRLIDQWGQRYFGSVDATPKYLLLAREYFKATGDNGFLDLVYEGSDGLPHTMRESFLMAADWIQTNVLYGPNVNPHDGQLHGIQDKPLLRFKRLNGRGIENQVMMDSRESFVYPDGTNANHDFPIADIGSQGQAYDALLFAADVANESPLTISFATSLKHTAQEIQENTLALWMEDKQYFAMGEDYNGPITTLCANVAELLSSTIFDNLPKEKKQKYVTGITKMLFSPEFLTEVGIRTRSLRHKDALTVNLDGQPVRFSDYHGTDTVWMEKLQWFIRGLDKQGLHSLADQMKMILLDAINTEGTHTEFFWVMPDGTPIYNHKSKQHHPGSLNATSLSENEQAWTISAVIATKKDFGNTHRLGTQPGSWQEILEQEIIESMKNQGLYREKPMKTRRQISQARESYQQGPHDTIDTTLGQKAQQVLHDLWGKGKEETAA